MSQCKQIVHFHFSTSLHRECRKPIALGSGQPADKAVEQGAAQECPMSYVDEIGRNSVSLPMLTLVCLQRILCMQVVFLISRKN